MKDSELRTRTKALALHIIAVCDEVEMANTRLILYRGTLELRQMYRRNKK